MTRKIKKYENELSVQRTCIYLYFESSELISVFQSCVLPDVSTDRNDAYRLEHILYIQIIFLCVRVSCDKRVKSS